MKNKITIDEQIEHMKSKNIKFQIMSEDDAKNFLSTRTYYFKLKSYAKSFQTMNTCNNYLKLDFAYLVELSTLDAHLRQFIMNLSLSIEHSLKTKLIRDFTNNPNEDGYTIISDFINQYPFILQNINTKRNDSACADLICKYHPDWPIWAIVEVLSFGDFIKLFRFYYIKYPDFESKKEMDLLWSAKFIRNAAAHNNCLLNSLRHPYVHTHLSKNNKIVPTKALQLEISRISGLSKNAKKRMLANPVTHDFIATLMLFDCVCASKAMKRNIYNDLHDLFENRFLRHQDYFKQDLLLVSSYNFILKIIDFLDSGVYNLSEEQKS